MAMRNAHWTAPILLLLGLITGPGVAAARGLSVEVSTNRGHDAVYEPGDAIQIKARTSDDAFLLVYEIDAEGFVHLLYPSRQSGGFVAGDRTYELPEADSDAELVVRGPVGQGYVVAVASLKPFRDLPWYLRPVNAQAEEMGYQGGPDSDEEEGVTAEGKVVGDPFVAMERIRRGVVDDPNDVDSFATAYTGYFVHHEVRYPRYLCADCHRPGRWAWWADFDPYYAHCSVFNFRVNWSWSWGPRYWCGFVPYYAYVYRDDCPPSYRRFRAGGLWHSSWDGWRGWNRRWGGALTRFKSDPPPDYVPPPKFDDDRRSRRRGDTNPPGYLADRSKRRLGAPRIEPVAGDLDQGSGGRTRRGGVPGYNPAPRPANDPEPGVGRNRRTVIDPPSPSEPSVGRSRRTVIEPPGPSEPSVGRSRRTVIEPPSAPDVRPRGRRDGEPGDRSRDTEPPRVERPREAPKQPDVPAREARPTWRRAEPENRDSGRDRGWNGGGRGAPRAAPSNDRPRRSKGD